MSVEIKVPALGESVTTATVSRWLKKVGEQVAQDEAIVELETDKVTVEVPSPQAGILSSQAVDEGDEVAVEALLAILETGVIVKEVSISTNMQVPVRGGSESGPTSAVSSTLSSSGGISAFPAAVKLMTENNVAATSLGSGSGKGGRITKGDVQAFLTTPTTTVEVKTNAMSTRSVDDGEERVKMTRLRKTIAQRLKDAQNTAAMLTTFNEVDMSVVIALRSEYKDLFEKKNNGIRLGFMSFFVKACVAALKDYPAANAEISGDEIIYKNFVHMGIAVGGASGLVVPVIRHADQMSFAQIEGAVTDFGKRAKTGALKIEELSGGTFSITNGGVYGSLMSTPILNPPQSAILGMHKIQERPVIINGKIEIRPMMYLALTYDHRIVDGREAVSLLVRVKEGIEDPRRLLLDL